MSVVLILENIIETIISFIVFHGFGMFLYYVTARILIRNKLISFIFSLFGAVPMFSIVLYPVAVFMLISGYIGLISGLMVVAMLFGD